MLQMISLDDKGSPQNAGANCQALIDTHRAFAFFGSTGSATTIAACAVLRDNGAALFSPYAVLDSARAKTEGKSDAKWTQLFSKGEVAVATRSPVGPRREASTKVTRRPERITLAWTS